MINSQEQREEPQSPLERDLITSSMALIVCTFYGIGYLIKKTYQYTFGETKSNKIPRHYDSERDNPHSRYE